MYVDISYDHDSLHHFIFPSFSILWGTPFNYSIFFYSISIFFYYKFMSTISIQICSFTKYVKKITSLLRYVFSIMNNDRLELFGYFECEKCFNSENGLFHEEILFILESSKVRRKKRFHLRNRLRPSFKHSRVRLYTQIEFTSSDNRAENAVG